MMCFSLSVCFNSLQHLLIMSCGLQTIVNFVLTNGSYHSWVQTTQYQPDFGKMVDL